MNLRAKKILGTSLLLGLAAFSSFTQTAMNLGSLPLWFEANRGQVESAAPFIARGRDSEFLISATGAQFVLHQATGRSAAARLQFVGANPAAPVTGAAVLAGKANYFIGNDPQKWQSDVPLFARVRVENIYPGVNLEYYGNDRQLEYDFKVAAGIDPQQIVLRFDGAEKISLNALGELVVSLPGGEVLQHPLLTYQNTSHGRQEIDSHYQILNDHTVTFALGSYDHTRPLVIDPILGYSTYFGGNKADAAHAIARDNNGFVYIAGETLSTVFTNAPFGYTNSFQGGLIKGDAFVAKFDVDHPGTNLIYVTYLGGSVDEVAYGLAVDWAGNAYVTGTTDSSNYPTANPIQPKIAGQIIKGYFPVDAFVTELNTNGSKLIYSTFLGGEAADIGTGIAVDANGAAYISGYTYSTNFPTSSGAYQTKLKCTNTLYFNANAFVAEIAPGGTSLKYSSYLGGTNLDAATAIAVDPSGYVYLTGYTASTNFPCTNAIVFTNTFAITIKSTNHISGIISTNSVWTNVLTSFNHLNGTTNKSTAFDAFVVKFNPGFSNLVYSSFLGGTNGDIGLGIACDKFGNAYVCGATFSTNFPDTRVPGLTSFVLTNYTSYPVATNAFLTQVKWNGGNPYIGYSTVFGGYGSDLAAGVALDDAGDVFVVGSASSTNFPVTPNNLIGSLRATNSGASDVVVTAFKADGSGLLYSTYLGGNRDDFGSAIAVDSAGDAYVTGLTISTNFPTLAAYQKILDGASDTFVTKILNTALPALNARASGTNVLVFWPAVGGEALPNFLGVETITNLNKKLIQTNWTLVAQVPVLTNGNYTYTFNPTNLMQFFRFHKY